MIKKKILNFLKNIVFIANEIGDKGISFLSNALKTNKTIENIDFSSKKLFYFLFFLNVYFLFFKR